MKIVKILSILGLIKKETINNIRELQKKYANYNYIIGYINDDSNRNPFKDGLQYLGGDSLFEYVFTDQYSKKIQEIVKKIVFDFYEKKTQNE